MSMFEKSSGILVHPNTHTHPSFLTSGSFCLFATIYLKKLIPKITHYCRKNFVKINKSSNGMSPDVFGNLKRISTNGIFIQFLLQVSSLAVYRQISRLLSVGPCQYLYIYTRPFCLRRPCLQYYFRHVGRAFSKPNQLHFALNYCGKLLLL